jgi:hypothetical protein
MHRKRCDGGFIPGEKETLISFEKKISRFPASKRRDLFIYMLKRFCACTPIKLMRFCQCKGKERRVGETQTWSLRRSWVCAGADCAHYRARARPGAKGVCVINIGGTQALVAPPRAQPVTHQRLSPRPTSGGLNSNPFSLYREGERNSRE